MKVNVLSPLHIGSGESYDSLLSYLDLQKNRLFVVDIEKFFKAIGVSLSVEFADWINKNMAKIDKLEDLKRKNKKIAKKINDEKWKIKKIFNLKNFLQENNISFHKIKSSCVIYDVNCENNPPFGKEIFPFIKQMNKVYIPGTEIKGAIRTALLYKIIKEDKDMQRFLQNRLKGILKEKIKINDQDFTYEELINEVKNKKKFNRKFKKYLVNKGKSIESKLQNLVFRRYAKDDPKYDLLKFLQVGDSELVEPSEVLSISYAEPFNTSKSFKVFYEYIIPDTQLSLKEFCIEFNLNKFENIGLTQKYKRLIKDVNAILSACYEFTKDLLEEEIAFSKAYELKDVLNQLIQIEAKNTPDTPVIRIGKDQGYLSITVGLAVKKLWPDLYENILIHTTKNISYDSQHGGPLPKSRKLVKWNGQSITAGWIQLIPDNIQKDSRTYSKKGLQDKDMNRAIEALKKKFKVRELKK